jgi:hypothetical protein
MSDREEEIDLDSPDAAQALLGDLAKKKPKSKAKAKAKAKVKKPRESDSSSGGVQLPLSMLTASSEDVAMFEAKLAALKAQKGSQQAYKQTQRFSVGDVIDHKSFGTGFVMTETGLNKIEVLFKIGRKMLVTAPRN